MVSLRAHRPGDKVVLGHTIHGLGLAEVDEMLDILCRHPSTARFVSRKPEAVRVLAE